MIAMFLYYALIIDMAVFNNSVSAYVLVCGRMLVEVGLFILALAVGRAIVARIVHFWQWGELSWPESCIFKSGASYRGQNRAF